MNIPKLLLLAMAAAAGTCVLTLHTKDVTPEKSVTGGAEARPETESRRQKWEYKWTLADWQDKQSEARLEPYSPKYERFEDMGSEGWELVCEHTADLGPLVGGKAQRYFIWKRLASL